MNSQPQALAGTSNGLPEAQSPAALTLASAIAIPAPISPASETAQPLERLSPIPEEAFFREFKAGDTDPLVGVKVKEVLVKAETYIVYLDQDLVLHWHWNAVLDSNLAIPIFNRAGELQAKSEFLRQTLRKRDLMNARRLIGQGLVVMFCTQNQAYANAALDTAEKFISQIGTETSRVWYFGPFFILFSASVLIGLILYNYVQMQMTTLPLVCALGGGIGAFISTTIGNERIPCAPSAGRFLHLLEALLRYAIGFAAGLLVWLAISGNVAAGFLNFASNPPDLTGNPESGNLPTSIYALITITIFAGASERLLPSLIAKFDDQIKTADPSPASKTEAS